MTKCHSVFVCIFVLMCAATVSAKEQYPLMNKAAGKVIQKYQQASCEQLWAEKGQQKSQQEQEVVQLLRADPQMRRAFINKIAAPVVNKMFECGMIP